MSKEDAEADERQRKNDDLRLKLAITESEKEKQKKKASALDDLLSIDLGISFQSNNTANNNLAISNSNQLDPWGTVDKMNNGLDAFGAVGGAISNSNNNSNDPWSSITNNSTSALNSNATANSSFKDSIIDNNLDPWSPKLTNDNSLSTSPWQSNSITATNSNNDPWASPTNNAPSLPSTLPINIQSNHNNSLAITRKTPENFLGANSNLVNLDALVSGKTNAAPNPTVGSNPFSSVSVPSNPFSKPPPPTINQLRNSTQNNFSIDSNNLNFMTSTSLPQQTQLNPLILNQPLNSTLTNVNNPFAM